MIHASFSPSDPKYLISICNDKLWQWDTHGHQIKPPFDSSYVAFSSDGTQFVTCNGAAITVQNSNSGVIVVKFQVTSSNTYCCCFSPDGRLIAIGGGYTAYVWDSIRSFEKWSDM